MKRLVILPFILFPLIAGAGTQFPCDSTVGNQIMNNAATAQQAKINQLQNYTNNINNNADPSSAILSSIESCADITGNIGFSFPTVDSFLQVIQNLINSECQKARSAIAAETKSLTGSVYVNSGTGFGTIGVTTTANSVGGTFNANSVNGRSFSTVNGNNTNNTQNQNQNNVYSRLKNLLGG